MAQRPPAKLVKVVKGTVEGIRTYWRYYLIPERYVFISVDMKDVEDTQRELIRRNFCPSLGPQGLAIPLSRMPKNCTIGKRVSIKLVVGKQEKESKYLVGHPGLTLEEIHLIR